MDIEQFAARLDALRVVPVVTIDDARDAAGLAAALTGGGLPIAEITFRTDAAAEAIAAIRAAQPALLVGAGTVLDVATADRALAAGAEFIVAPGLNPSVVEHCLARGVAVIPGVATPTEIEAALAMSIGLMKFFPAEAMGGVRYLSAFAAPYRGIRFMPTGGINPGNLAAYLALANVVACGGTWIASAEAIREQRWDEITRLAAEAVEIARGARA
ncbi:MAG TPA: bifunctional 4-hydroxy-2-oxoglutarate aldolase/2-dehydro-3-deoxy-phosphogluconate aldolase [Candidatus Limnocylindrales bacterium]|nr:bifunctional 4-hydroxy-2-oxoglutarate aldolase/2-dehydro-3-deoxy-phosphogluconate aldolase [Candidatus Limnocylindrales bacterium]